MDFLLMPLFLLNSCCASILMLWIYEDVVPKGCRWLSAHDRLSHKKLGIGTTYKVSFSTYRHSLVSAESFYVFKCPLSGWWANSTFIPTWKRELCIRVIGWRVVDANFAS